MNRRNLKYKVMIFLFMTIIIVGSCFAMKKFDEKKDSYILGTNIEESYGKLVLSIASVDFESIRDKKIVIREDNGKLSSVTISSPTIEVNLPVSKYTLIMPTLEGYINRTTHFEIKALESTNLTYQYIYDWKNDYVLKMLSKDEIVGDVAFSKGFTHAVIKRNSNFNKDELEIVIYDRDENIVTPPKIETNPLEFRVDLEAGYKIKLTNKKDDLPITVQVYNTLNDSLVEEYNRPLKEIIYTKGEFGLLEEGMPVSKVEELYYKDLKLYLQQKIDDYLSKVTPFELGNKNINSTNKKIILEAYESLKEEDRIAYITLVEQIKKGGVPVVNTTGRLEYKVGEKIDLYALLTVTDTEDGKLLIDEKNCEIKTDLDVTRAGLYKVTYYIKDSDGNRVEHSLYLKITMPRQISPQVKPNKNDTGTKIDVKPQETVPSKKYQLSEIDVDLSIKTVDSKRSTREVIYLFLLILIALIFFGLLKILKKKRKKLVKGH